MTNGEGEEEAVTVRSDDVPTIAESEVGDESDVGDDQDGGALEADTVEPVAPQPSRRRRLGRVVAFGVLPALALLLATGAGYLKWRDGSIRDSQTAAEQSVRAATENTIAMLSYQPDTVEKDLSAAGERMTGTFRDTYTRLINEVVIPGSKERRVSAVATVPAAASVSAAENHAVVLVFVNQTTTVGTDPPTATTSSVRVTLEKAGEKWLVSQFEPI